MDNEKTLSNVDMNLIMQVKSKLNNAIKINDKYIANTLKSGLASL